MKKNEKIWYAAIVVMLALLAGCAAPRQYYQQPMPSRPAQEVVIPPGYVVVDIPNPLTMPQEVYLFWGGDPVSLVPDSDSKSGWSYNRPAMAEPFFILKGRKWVPEERKWVQAWAKGTQPFEVKMGYGDRNWGYTSIAVPRSSCFVLAARAANAWGYGPPNIVPFCSGSDPFSTSYTRNDPTCLNVRVGGVTPALYSTALAPFGPGPLNINATIDLSNIGRGIANGITNWIWGR